MSRAQTPPRSVDMYRPRSHERSAASLALSCAFIAAGFAWGCASAHSEPVSAADHRARAAEERAAAEAARDPGVAPAPPGGARLDRAAPIGDVNPPLAPQGDAQSHEARARRHENAAQQLEESEETACVDVAPARRAACPIFEIVGVTDVPSGVRIAFPSEQAAIAATDVIRCQQAFARTRGYTGVPECALYARGLTVMQRGTTVELTAEQPDDVTRLRENVRSHGASAKKPGKR